METVKKFELRHLCLLMSASSLLFSCSENGLRIEETEDRENNFEIAAAITKTANNGLGTDWTSGDAIGLFHAVTGAAEYLNDGKFTVDEALEGVFSGKLNGELAEDGSYDWYAIYPYSSDISSPASSTGILIGGGADEPQQQSGNNSKAHLCGAACPLYGIARNVASETKPSVVMGHLSSVVEVKVTNTFDAPLSVSSVSFTSTEPISGQFNIDFSSDSPVYASGSSVSNTASLSVSGGETIDKGASATFYIVVKPHTVPAGSTLSIAVNGVEKTLSLSDKIEFKAGRILSLNYNSVPVAYGLDLGEGYGNGNEGTHANLRFSINNTNASKGYAYSSKYDFTSMSEITLECLVRFNHQVPWGDADGKNFLNQLLGNPDYFGIRINHTDGTSDTAPTTGKFNCQIGSIELNSQAVTLDEWHHVALTFKDGTATVYVDGQAQESNGSCDATIDLTKVNNGEGKYHDFLIGQYGQSRWLNGCLAEVRVWSVARTAEQIAANPYYVSESSEGLLAYWKMCGTTWDEILKDYTSNGFDIEHLNNSDIVEANVVARLR